jgi:hypothetical protein
MYWLAGRLKRTSLPTPEIPLGGPQDNVLLGREVPEEHGWGHLGGSRDLLNGGGPKALVAEEPERLGPDGGPDLGLLTLP